MAAFARTGLMRLRTIALLAALALPGASSPAQQVSVDHVLIVTGLSGEPSFAATFNGIGESLADAARSHWEIASGNVTWLAEQVSGSAARADGRSTRGAIDSAIARIASRSRAGQAVAVFLVGHGSGEGAESKLSIPGADPTASEYASWLDRLSGRTVVVFVAASGSGDFAPVLARPDRVVITATRSSTERNESLFATRLSHGLVSREADSDKDGRISVLEAFEYANREVQRAYESTNRLRTEHAQLEDDGDGKPSAEPGSAGATDGRLARRIVFGKQPTASDPAVARLFDERRRLEVEVEELRRRKESMREADYQRELEALLVQIAERTRAIRAAQGGGRQ
jgi:hypothetical protein